MERRVDADGNTYYIDEDGVIFPACVGCEGYDAAVTTGEACGQFPCAAYPKVRRER